MTRSPLYQWRASIFLRNFHPQLSHWSFVTKLGCSLLCSSGTTTIIYSDEDETYQGKKNVAILLWPYPKPYLCAPKRPRDVSLSPVSKLKCTTRHINVEFIAVSKTQRPIDGRLDTHLKLLDEFTATRPDNAGWHNTELADVAIAQLCNKLSIKATKKSSQEEDRCALSNESTWGGINASSPGGRFAPLFFIWMNAVTYLHPEAHFVSLISMIPGCVSWVFGFWVSRSFSQLWRINRSWSVPMFRPLVKTPLRSLWSVRKVCAARRSWWGLKLSRLISLWTSSPILLRQFGLLW